MVAGEIDGTLTPSRSKGAERVAHVEGEIIIRRAVEDVFDLVADERNEPRYNRRIVRAEKTSPVPIGLGTPFRAELEAVCRTMPMTIECTGYDRPRRLGSLTRSAMMSTDGALSFTPVADGTRMRWSWDIRPRGVLRLMSPLVSLLGGRRELEISGNLKRLLERGDGA
jgi:Polyketide cyclase / dehydrase and lipid transport